MEATSSQDATVSDVTLKGKDGRGFTTVVETMDCGDAFESIKKRLKIIMELLEITKNKNLEERLKHLEAVSQASDIDEEVSTENGALGDDVHHGSIGGSLGDSLSRPASTTTVTLENADPLVEDVPVVGVEPITEVHEEAPGNNVVEDIVQEVPVENADTDVKAAPVVGNEPVMEVSEEETGNNVLKALVQEVAGGNAEAHVGEVPVVAVEFATGVHEEETENIVVEDLLKEGDLGDALETMQKQLRTLMKMVELFNQICQDEKGKTEDAAKQDEDLKTGNAEQEVEVASFGSAVETASIPTTNGAFNTTVPVENDDIHEEPAPVAAEPVTEVHKEESGNTEVKRVVQEGVCPTASGFAEVALEPATEGRLQPEEDEHLFKEADAHELTGNMFQPDGIADEEIEASLQSEQEVVALEPATVGGLQPEEVAVENADTHAETAQVVAVEPVMEVHKEDKGTTVVQEVRDGGSENPDIYVGAKEDSFVVVDDCNGGENAIPLLPTYVEIVDAVPSYEIRPTGTQEIERTAYDGAIPDVKHLNLPELQSMVQDIQIEKCVMKNIIAGLEGLKQQHEDRELRREDKFRRFMAEYSSLEQVILASIDLQHSALGNIRKLAMEALQETTLNDQNQNAFNGTRPL